MIRIQNLRFKYPKSDFELSIPELQIAAGEKVALIGPSGSGKTTLLNLIAGIETPLTGDLTVDGEQLFLMPESQRRNFRISRVGFVFQQFELLDYLTAADNILLPFFINSSLELTAERKKLAWQRADQMGLAGKLNRHPERLSQGEQQRVAICRALVNDPALILADEPTGNLDPVNKRKILELLFELVSSGGQTLIVVTHDLGILEGFDRIIDFQNFEGQRCLTSNDRSKIDVNSCLVSSRGCGEPPESGKSGECQ
jgi:putative ABC transport system ATP-binding protein